jgi:hypothetical protein
MDAHALRTLTPAEAASVGGGFDVNELAASALAGAAYGAPIGALLMGPISPYLGGFMGAMIGGFFGGGYYLGSELVDYCF